MSKYPKMLYRPSLGASPEAVDINGQSFDTLIVADADEDDAATDDGWASFADAVRTARPLPTAESANFFAEAQALADTSIVDGLTERADVAEAALASANSTISTLRTEVSLANDRIATLEAEKADIADKLAALDKDGDGSPGGSVAQDPPALTGKTKAELLAIAAAEGATVEDGALNADIIAAIELKREAAA